MSSVESTVEFDLIPGDSFKKKAYFVYSMFLTNFLSLPSMRLQHLGELVQVPWQPVQLHQR